MTVSYAGFDYWYHGAPILYSGRSMDFSVWYKGAPLVQLAGSLLDMKCSAIVEWVATQKSDQSFDPEWRATLDELIKLQIESSGIWQTLYGSVPVEFRGTIKAVQNIQIGWRATLDETFGVTPEFTLTIAATCDLPLNWGGSTTLDTSVTFEVASIVAYLTKDIAIPIEFFGSVNADHTLSLEWRATLPSKLDTLPADFLASIQSLKTAPLEWIGAIRIPVTVPVDFLGYHNVGSKLESLPIDTTGTTFVQIITSPPVEFDGFNPLELWLMWNVTKKFSKQFDLDWNVFGTAIGIVFPLKWRVYNALPMLQLQWNVIPAQLLIDSDIQKPVASGEKTP